MKKHNFKKLMALGLAAGFVASAPVHANEDKDTSGTVLAAKDESSSSVLAGADKEESSEAVLMLAGGCGSRCGNANRRGAGYNQNPQVVEEDEYYQGQRGQGCSAQGGQRGHSCASQGQVPPQYQYRT